MIREAAYIVTLYLMADKQGSRAYRGAEMIRGVFSVIHIYHFQIDYTGNFISYGK